MNNLISEMPDAIAVIGLAVRFPGADSVEAFWANLRAGKESLTLLTDEALLAAGVDPTTIANPAYVRANGVITGVEEFDAAFFGMTPREAAITDPQHRVFLELAWQAFERAGYDPARVPGPVGVFAGAGLSTYLLRNLMPNREVIESAGELALLLGNNKDFVPTRTSYKLDLRGPSINVNTACSTSLVATHLACQSLLDHHCDMALAGGVSVQVPQEQGYLYAEGGIGSPDGHCRAFDAGASGTVSGNGCGIVVLRRLADALADGDQIHAVIRGSAVNNDGADKAGFTAPSVTGQSHVIAEAQAVAAVSPADISYVEAHGTGTPLGDPIEVAALTEAFSGLPAGSCALGSVKTNFGHLDEAAGIAGLAKTILALQHRELPPSLHYTTPNPRIDFPNTPFRVNATLTPWSAPSGQPRIAGVSSFGIGGTNAHVILAEAPTTPTAPSDDRPQLLLLSARTPSALITARRNLADWLDAHPDADLANVAFTLSQGRRGFTHRTAVVANNARQAATALREAAGFPAPEAPPDQVWILSGQGSPYPGMLAGLYVSEPVVRETIDQCAALLHESLRCDMRALLAPDSPDAAVRLRDTAIAQPVVFVADYALAKLWLSRGCEPTAMIGHSLGEYVAACLAGIFSLEDALKLVTARGALMAAQPVGAMLSIGQTEIEATRLAKEHGLHLAAINAPNACVLAGPLAAIEAVTAQLTKAGIAATLLETSHAFHSAMMDSMLPAFSKVVRTIKFHPPRRRIISGLSGMPLTDAEATDPDTWVRHVRQPVRFAAAVALAARTTRQALWLEVGPGRGLASMVKRCLDTDAVARVHTSTRHAAESVDDRVHFMHTAARFWCAGVSFEWSAWFAPGNRRRIVLPTYPFERTRHWIDAPTSKTANDQPVAAFNLSKVVRDLDAAEARWRRDPILVEHPSYAEFSNELNPWCAARVFHYITAALPDLAVGQRNTRADVASALRIAPAFEKCLTFLLHVLATDGYLRLGEDGELEWLCTSPVSLDTAELRRRFPDFNGIVRLVEHCTSHYAEALSGDIPAITVLYPEGKTDLLESTAKENAPHTDKRVYLRLLRNTIEAKLAAQPGRRLRILEVGIGDGLLAGELAPALKGRGVDYVATDLSRAFVNKAQTKATTAGLDFITFSVLDISRDPIAQGFTAGDFDFIVALDVVHATPRLADTLGHLRTLLAPGGCFGIVEKVRSERWVDLVWGLAEGWWYFADTTIRPLTPLMPANRWESVIRSLDFEHVAVFPRQADARATTDYALLLAQTSATPSIDVSGWAYTTETDFHRMAPVPSGATIFDAAKGLSALITLANQLGANGKPHTLVVQTDDSPEQLMLMGAVRTIIREYPQLIVRPMQRDGRAATLRLRPIERTETAAFNRRPGGTTLITGGFGSMGRVFARELAREPGAKLILLGRRIDAPEHRAFLAELEKLGAKVLARAVDVADAATLNAAIADARKIFGAFHGVIHTAGIYGQGLMSRRDPTEIAATLAPKVTGTLNLAAALAGEPLDFFILCSSLASVCPQPGQIDYATANAFLDAFAIDHHRRTGIPTLSISWGVWQELGMMEHTSLSAAQQQSVRDEIEREGWTNIGATLWRYVLQHGGAYRHLLISPTPVRAIEPPVHPLFTSRSQDESGRVSFTARLDPQQHWIVNDHRLDGLALLPGTGFLELARAAFAEKSGASAVELSEVYFLHPLLFGDNQPREVQVILDGDTFKVISRVDGDAWLEHTRGEIRAASQTTATVTRLTVISAPEKPSAEAVLFGPHWQCIEQIAFGDACGIAELSLPETCRDDLSGYGLHPALFDMAIGFITLRHGLPDSLPFCYRRLVVHHALPARFRSEVRVVARSADGLELAAALFDANDQLLVEVEGYRLRRMGRPAPVAAPDQARLTIRPGTPDGPLHLVPDHRTPPRDNEVEIEILAAGLNFIEVLYAHGMLPASPDLEARFGLECAGRIVRVGPGVETFAVGDEVIAYSNGCFSSYVTVPLGYVAPLPLGLTMEAGATLPGAYATAHYALVTQARLRAGEKVLIHAAAGGVGQAAVNIARHLKAEIYATAGSEEKRAFLRSLGITHVMDSRSLTFADEIRQLTGGRGVDVVLNSLGGDFLRASLELVAPRGRFVELGKRDLLGGNSLDLAPFARIISFIVIDVGPDLPDFKELWTEVSARFADGTYPALPHEVFAMTNAGAAFEHMARARHIGKVVLNPGDPAKLLAAAREAPPLVGRSRAAILGEPTVKTPITAAKPKKLPAVETLHAKLSDDTQRTIAAIWQELLGVETVGPDDDFFTLRGDSLLAAQVMARIQQALQVKLPLSSIFDAPTVAGLAGRVRRERGESSKVGEDEEEGEL
jgi:acyl transferase domain-containing protein/NAD(P)-dependent dehydrogenase (short-subunit alcohol dehydrogenase family)/SAM-dependent methyltransferase